MIKAIIYAVVIAGLVYAGSTVKLGKRTFFEHVRAIWHTEQMQDLKVGVEDTAKPAVEKLKKGGAAAIHAMKGHEVSGSGSDARPDGGSDSGVDAGSSSSGATSRRVRQR